MAHLENDIKVTYINATGHNDFMLLVFTKNEDVNAIESPYVAWHKIQAQSSATFWYPVDASIGAHWESAGALIRAGPFQARLGTTWYLTSYQKDDSPNLAQGRCHGTLRIIRPVYNYQGPRVLFHRTFYFHCAFARGGAYYAKAIVVELPRVL